jgi:hypothetical protein
MSKYVSSFGDLWFPHFWADIPVFALALHAITVFKISQLQAYFVNICLHVIYVWEFTFKDFLCTYSCSGNLSPIAESQFGIVIEARVK